MEEKVYCKISLMIRLSASIVSGVLLYKITPVTNLETDMCPCFFVFIMYLFCCFFAAVTGKNDNYGSIIYYIIFIILGMILSIVSIVFGHIVCAGFILLATIISIMVETNIELNF